MKYLKILLLFSLIVPFFGCQENTNAEQKQSGEENAAGRDDEKMLRDGIFVVHDEAMAKMGEIHRLKKQLRDISRNPSLTLDSITREEVTQVLVQLDNAGNGMMEWMASFKQPMTLRKQKSHDEIMTYLAEEKSKVDAVSTNISSSVDVAKKLYAKLKK